MLPVDLSDTTAADIQSLINSEVPESLTVEYKEALPGTGSDDKREFLYDIAAFANQAGGDIVYGVADRRGEDKQSTGIADRLAGMKIANVQTEIARLSHLISDCTAPKLSGVKMWHVTCEGGEVLVIRIPRSWNKPHMVVIDRVNRFYIRTNTGKELMRVEEVGRAFSEQRELGETIEAWRAHRAELVLRGKGPLNLAGNVKMLFHVIPPSAFNRDLLRETWTIAEQDKMRVYVPHSLSNAPHYNADGFIASCQVVGLAYGYTQLFRSGIIEYADCQCSGPIGHDTQHMILGQELEKQMVKCLQDAIPRFRSRENTTAYIGFTLTGIGNQSFYSTMFTTVYPQPRIVLPSFTSPLVFVDATDIGEPPYPSALLPLVDTMWQISGREGTPFKPNGVWNPFGEYQ